MTKKINFLNIPIDAITMQETLQKVETAIATKKQIHHTVVNAGKVVLMQTDKELEKSVITAGGTANLETDDLENKLKDFFKKYDPKFKDKEENQEDI